MFIIVAYLRVYTEDQSLECQHEAIFEYVQDHLGAESPSSSTGPDPLEQTPIGKGISTSLPPLRFIRV